MSEARGSSPTPRRTGVRPGPGGGGQNRSQTATRHRRFAWALGIVGAIVPAIVLVLAWFYDMLPSAEIRKWAALWPAAVLIGVWAALQLVYTFIGPAFGAVANASASPIVLWWNRKPAFSSAAGIAR